MPRLLHIILFTILVTASAFAGTADSVSFFGIQTHFGQGRPDLDSVMNLVQASGLKAIRDEVYWHDIETTQGVFTFTPAHDAYISGALARGIKPLIILDYGNALYGGTPRDSGARAAFGRYCQAVVGRYAPMGVKHFEVWNEPNLCLTGGFCPWSPGPNASEYFELLKVAYAAIKAVDSTSMVIGCATSPLDEPETSEKIPGDIFIQRVFALGGASYMDAVSFHQYPIGQKPESWIPTETAHVRAAMGGTPKPMWITEIGHFTGTRSDAASEAVQGQLIARTYLVGRIEPGLQRISWYDLMDDCDDPANAECRYGILRRDRSPKPAFIAITTAATLTGHLPVTASGSQNGGYQVRFGSPGQEVVAAWTMTGTVTMSVNISTAYAKIVDWQGKTTAIAQAGSYPVSLTASEYPQYVVALPDGPSLNEFHIRPHEAIFDSTQQIGFTASGMTADSLPVAMSPTQVAWTYDGTGGSFFGGGFFVANAAGSGTVIGSFGGRSDSASITIVPRRGTFLLDDCSSLEGWTIVLTKMDTSATRVTTDTMSVDGNPSFRIQYQYQYDGGTGFAVSIRPPVPIMLPGRPDSLQLAVYGDGRFHKLTYILEDTDGGTFSLIATALNQSNLRWRTVNRVPVPIGGAHEYPYKIRSIEFVPSTAEATVGAVMSGTVYFDRLTAKFNFTTAVESEPAALPASTVLLPGFPNPFNPSTMISYESSVTSHNILNVYDALGREVALLVDAIQPPGRYSIRFDAAGLASGIYLCRLQAGTRAFAHKLLLVR